jgi:hypothetical protein
MEIPSYAYAPVECRCLLGLEQHTSIIYLEKREYSFNAVTIQTGRPRIYYRNGNKFFLYRCMFRPTTEPIQPLIHLMQGPVSPPKIRRGMKLNIHLRVTTRLKVGGAMSAPSHIYT